MLASTANYLMHLGWKRGQPWIQEVRVPQNLPWEQADLSIQHPRSQWAKWGVTRADGKPLETDAMPASLVLPMGRFGPAFLAFDNFKVYTEWNNSLIYSLTAAYYATRLAGAPAYNPGHGREDPRLEPATKCASCRRCSPSADLMSAGSTAYWGSRAARRSAPCRSSSSCRPIPGRPRNCSAGLRGAK